jgi:hypothetical protein
MSSRFTEDIHDPGQRFVYACTHIERLYAYSGHEGPPFRLMPDQDSGRCRAGCDAVMDCRSEAGFGSTVF